MPKDFSACSASSFAYCDAAFSALTDERAVQLVKQGRMRSPVARSSPTSLARTTRSTASSRSTCGWKPSRRRRPSGRCRVAAGADS